jgi:polygalacturonase
MYHLNKIIFLIIISIPFTAVAQNNMPVPSRLYSGLPFAMARIVPPAIPPNSVNLTDFGAAGDGKTINTQAIANAIESLSAKGGGTLEIGAGKWITGPIVLKSNIRLHMAKDAVIQFSDDRNLYPVVKGNFEGTDTYRCQSPISADGAENIAISGEGIIDGSGHAWRPVKKSKMPADMWKAMIAGGGVLDDKKSTWWPSESAYRGSRMATDQNVPAVKNPDDWQSIKDYLRPVMVDLTNCKNILIEGVTIQNSPSWTLHPLLCENVIITGINVQNPEWGQNTDGIDIESCKNIVVWNSTFSVGDDGICVKSGKNEPGRKRGRPTENLIVAGCTVCHAHGGFVVGSEMSGGVRNVSVSDCTFKGTDAGLRFKSTRGRGGVVENIDIQNISMSDIQGDAVLFDLFYGGDKNNNEKVEANETTPVFRNISMKNITCNGAKRALYFNGLPEMNLENISLSNGSFIADEGGRISESSGVTFTNITLTVKSNPALSINNSQNIIFSLLAFPATTKPVINISGTSSQYISIQKSPWLSYKNITWSDHASKDSVEVRGW